MHLISEPTFITSLTTFHFRSLSWKPSNITINFIPTNKNKNTLLLKTQKKLFFLSHHLKQHPLPGEICHFSMFLCSASAMSYFCFSVNGDLKTRIKNETEIAVDLQVRVGAVMKKAYTLKPGKGRSIDCKKIHKAYGPGRDYQICQPYIWIHNPSNFTRLVKQQYISLEDLRDHSEIRICKDPRRGSFVVIKKPRSDGC